MAADVKILRGNIIHTPAFGELETLAGGYLVLEDGVIQGYFRFCRSGTPPVRWRTGGTG